MIELDRVSKAYGPGPKKFQALDKVSLRVEAGEIAAITGPSGAGKSTLSRCISLLTRPTAGTVSVDGQDLTRLGRRQLRSARQSIGTIFQGSNLLARATVAENIALPLDFLGATRASAARRVGELLDLVGLGDKAGAYPAQLSGGQRQRVGIARALALKPSVLLADEATSGLDPSTTVSILDLIRSIRDTQNVSVVLITHEMDVVRAAADTVARLEAGRIVESGPVGTIAADPSSALAADLLRHGAPVRPTPGTEVWQVQYGPGAVALDWPQRLGAALGSPVEMLAASIESIGGPPAGRATISVRAGLPEASVHESLAAVGLHGHPALPATVHSDAPGVEVGAP
ncbi:methionine ABC transporter ATP-binding protein [Arthrobacter sp. GCM10027362]|uniref:methionine ABC transporter ATP-binding protein n=1 Tax=Arthrobacter sp. GCM10027362 TaxID=3273379 RepID=UPI00363C5D4D